MNSKTPVSLLQELMMKNGELPTYEFINQTGPQHMASFEYRCTAGSVTATATARSKKEAKQEVARRVLAKLAPGAAPPLATSPSGPALAPPESAGGSGSADRVEGDGDSKGEGSVARSHVMLLKELCEQFHLGAVEYELVGDTGPPHNRRFTVTATLGRHERSATANTKKAARQLAAEQLYNYLRKNLASTTKDFVEKRVAILGLKTPERTQSVEVKMEKSSEKDSTEKCFEENIKMETNSEEAAGNVKVSINSEQSAIVGTSLDTKLKNTPKDNPVLDSPRKRKSEDGLADEQQNKRHCDVETVQNVTGKNEDALARALDKVMSRFAETKEAQPWRPDLGQRVADYHLAEEQQQAAERVLETEQQGDDPVAQLQALAAALGLAVQLDSMQGENALISVVSLSPTSPALALAGFTPRAAAAAALRYVRRALRQNRPLHPLHPLQPLHDASLAPRLDATAI